MYGTQDPNAGQLSKKKKEFNGEQEGNKRPSKEEKTNQTISEKYQLKEVYKRSDKNRS